jgi:hypothetical protein
VLAGGGAAGGGEGGGGAGGGGNNQNGALAANGGSGIVIIRYLSTYDAATVTGTPNVIVSGGYRIYSFTDSGSITF